MAKDKAPKFPVAPIKGAKVTLQKAVGVIPAGRYRVVKVRAKAITIEPVKHLSKFRSFEVQI